MRALSLRLGGLLLASAAVLAPRPAAALGVRIPNQDAMAIGRGNAFVATADNPSAIYYNPAGITQLDGHQVQVGSLFYLNIYTDYEAPSGARTANDPEVIPVPQLHYTFTPPESPFSFGLGVYAPFGLSVKWPEDAPFREAGLESQLAYMTLNPVVAWKIHPRLSVAAGPTFNYSEITLRQATPFPGMEFKFNGDNFGYGFNTGLRWQPHDRWALGATYRSAATINYRGTGEFNMLLPSSDASAELRFPQIVAAGVSFRPTPDWNIEVNVDWTDWTSFRELKILGVPGVTPTRLEWQDSFFYELGVTRRLGKGYFASVGYFYSEQSTRSEYFTPLVPDTDLHVGSLGAGYRGQHWSWALSGQIIAGPWRTIEDNVNPPVNGQYRLWTPTVAFTVGYRF